MVGRSNEAAEDDGAPPFRADALDDVDVDVVSAADDDDAAGVAPGFARRPQVFLSLLLTPAFVHPCCTA